MTVALRKVLPVSEPLLDHAEAAYVAGALADGAISGYFGQFLDRFEREFANFCECKHAVAVVNGTAAIHLALAVLDIGAGDEVLVAAYTNMATFFPVLYQGARPIPIDIEPDTWNIDPRLIEAKITSRTRAIIVVHIFGHPVDMDPVVEIAQRHNLYVIEDCAEAHGALYKGRKVGGLGTIGCFSFYANKIITTGEGGMITLNDPALTERARAVKSLAFGRKNKFMHTEIGFNYRMSNLQAAMGCAQMAKIGRLIEMKRDVARRYAERLADVWLLRLPVEKDYARNVYWMYHIVLDPRAPVGRDELMARLAEDGIETRPGFLPFNMQEIFITRGLTELSACPVANEVGTNSFYVPSGPVLADSEIDYVCDRIKAHLGIRT